MVKCYSTEGKEAERAPFEEVSQQGRCLLSFKNVYRDLVSARYFFQGDRERDEGI